MIFFRLLVSKRSLYFNPRSRSIIPHICSHWQLTNENVKESVSVCGFLPLSSGIFIYRYTSNILDSMEILLYFYWRQFVVGFHFVGLRLSEILINGGDIGASVLRSVFVIIVFKKMTLTHISLIIVVKLSHNEEY